MSNISSKLKEKRIAADLSKKVLAERSGISRQTIIDIENGTRTNITTETLRKLADALGCLVDDLI